MLKKIATLLAAMVMAAHAQAQLEAVHQTASEHDHDRPPSTPGATAAAAAGEQRQKKQLYTCPMHPEVVRNEPGTCPKCGMTLVPLKSKKQRPTPNAQHSTPNAEKAAAVHRTGHTIHAEHEHDQEHEHEMKMQSSVNIADPMSRESSGTAWMPDSTPMYGHMIMFGEDMLMLHGGI